MGQGWQDRDQGAKESERRRMVIDTGTVEILLQ
jgi:hypothetical protein